MIIGKSDLKKKFGWFLVLMVWVGMVTAVVVHQLPEEEQLAEVSSKQEVEIETTDYEEMGEDQLKEVDKLEEELAISVAEEKSHDQNFFVEYRMERDQARSEQINLLREMINNPNSDNKLKVQAQERLLKITNNIEKEMGIESMIRARGYDDGLAFLHDNSIELIIATEGLQKQDVAKIGDIVSNSTGIGLENVTIIEKKPE
ncbi:SpoIIIAH-like family protein [Natroniella sulfidigena]|uniref:SpoIIIAH-like family protein n=1 Tax=Natroniella sulfidigena TaxID=723921 RepID=UPI00200A7370|nr:SpoIIIAH-like family protein [Natroniella sulfidigena]MCK8817505.1 SpoIIIAH-like family protein [Natroniella sulfidigena]